ncbi:MAG: SpoIIE family protein phosphatase, partial [Phycisphaerales bacterium]|nr:SpoIIE family protein phosphatase [Phycisphaerales bacterium]
MRGEAQQRVRNALATAQVIYDDRLEMLAVRLSASVAEARRQGRLESTLDHIAATCGLDRVRLMDADESGKTIEAAQKWAFGEHSYLVRVAASSRGVVFGTIAVPAQPEKSAAARLEWQIAVPMLAGDQAPVEVILGSLVIENEAVVDEIRDLVFGSQTYDGVPVGTVTLFSQDTRVATNVLGLDGRRALGTQVSERVRRSVLVAGEEWLDRALVVDQWYLSGYTPLRDPSGAIIGMLYVGLLDSPYVAMRASLIRRYVGTMAVIAGVALGVTSLVIRRITHPLARLVEAANEIAGGERDGHIDAPTRLVELSRLGQSFQTMQKSIRDRDRHLARQNSDLQQANSRMSAGLASAASLQQGLLPEPLPVGASFSAAWRFQPCDELGGDILNIVPLGNGKFAIYVLDVTGHGVPAALLSVSISQLLVASSPESSILMSATDQANVFGIAEPGEVLSRLNDRIQMESTGGRFVTIAYAIVDTTSWTMRYALAGHPPLILVQADGKAVCLGDGGLPVGVLAGAEYETHQVELQPADRVYLYSDGVTESMSPHGEMFSLNGLADVLSKSGRFSLEQSLDRCLRDAR